MSKIKGFNVVIGNPPYVQLQRDNGKLRRRHSVLPYAVFMGTSDLYCLFFELSLRIATDGGSVSLLTPNKWLYSGYGRLARDYLLKFDVIEVVDLSGIDLWDGVSVDVAITTIKKRKPQFQARALKLLKYFNGGPMEVFKTLDRHGHPLPQPDGLSWTIETPEEKRSADQIANSGVPLSEYIHNGEKVVICGGFHSGHDRAFLINEDHRGVLVTINPAYENILKPIIRGRDLVRFGIEPSRRQYLIHTPPRENIDIDKYMELKIHLSNYRHELDQSGLIGQRHGHGGEWYEIQRGLPAILDGVNMAIVFSRITATPRFALLNIRQILPHSTCFVLQGNPILYLLGILNSNVVEFWVKRVCTRFGRNVVDLKKPSLFTTPVPLITKYNQNKVNSIMEISQQIAKMVSMKLDIADLLVQLNDLVYDLYGLNKSQITTIEEGIKRL